MPRFKVGHYFFNRTIAFQTIDLPEKSSVVFIGILY